MSDSDIKAEEPSTPINSATKTASSPDAESTPTKPDTNDLDFNKYKESDDLTSTPSSISKTSTNNTVLNENKHSAFPLQVTKTKSFSKKTSPPTIPSRTSSTTRNRNSRTHSLIIPVLSTPERKSSIINTTSYTNTSSPDNKDNDDTDTDLVDMNQDTMIDLESSPKLPQRPPKLPPKIAIPENETYDSEFLENQHLDRLNGLEFSPTSIRSRKFSVSTINSIGIKSIEEPLTTINERFLIQSRKYQIETISSLLETADLTISKAEYYEKVHSSNSFVEIISEIHSGSFENPNIPILYSIILNSIKMKNMDVIFNNCLLSKLDDKILNKFDDIILKLDPLLKSTYEQKLNFKNDLIKVYSLLNSIHKTNNNNNNNNSNGDSDSGNSDVIPEKESEDKIGEKEEIADTPSDEKSADNDDLVKETNTTINRKMIEPNALVAAFLYRCASPYILPQATVFATLINEFIFGKKKEFHFLMLRAIESIDEKILIFNLDENTNPLSYLISLFESNEFWCGLVLKLYENDKSSSASKNSNVHRLGLTNVLHNVVIYGMYSLINTIIELRYELEIFGLKKDDKPVNEKEDQKPLLLDLTRFHREFLVLQDTAESRLISDSLDQLSERNKDLKQQFEEKKKLYNELQQNFQQLNGEKISISGLIEKIESENVNLKAEKRSLEAKVEYALSQYDVIKQTVEKNKQVQQMNDSMRNEISRLEKEVAKLKT